MNVIVMSPRTTCSLPSAAFALIIGGLTAASFTESNEPPVAGIVRFSMPRPVNSAIISFARSSAIAEPGGRWPGLNCVGVPMSSACRCSRAPSRLPSIETGCVSKRDESRRRPASKVRSVQDGTTCDRRSSWSDHHHLLGAGEAAERGVHHRAHELLGGGRDDRADRAVHVDHVEDLAGQTLDAESRVEVRELSTFGLSSVGRERAVRAVVGDDVQRAGDDDLVGGDRHALGAGHAGDCEVRVRGDVEAVDLEAERQAALHRRQADDLRSTSSGCR